MKSGSAIFDVAYSELCTVRLSPRKALLQANLEGPPWRATEKREEPRNVPSVDDVTMKRETIAIADIYVPVKRRATLDQRRVDEIAASMLDKGLQTPILVRADGPRFVLVEGLHRLEAAKALGEKTIIGFLVNARKH
jgi:sulfiredoxin